MSLVLGDIVVVHADGRRALSRASLAVARGEHVALIGPAGAGKTTLLRVAAASLRPTRGDVTVLGEAPWRVRPRALRALRARVGLVHQEPPIPAGQRVVAAVLAGRLGRWSLAHSLRSLVVPADLAGARAALARVGLAHRLFDDCGGLGDGELRQVAVARTLYQAPSLLLADEPIRGLDAAAGERALGELVAQARSTGASLVVSMRSVEVASRWFPRLVGLRGGRVRFDLPCAAVTPGRLRTLYEADRGARTGPGLPPSSGRPRAETA